jgi:cation:H+ antiporter
MLSLLFVLAGFIVLIFGADFLVNGSSALAKRLHIPNIVIGLTIVAFGTSSPELVVNIFAAINKNSEIVLGNILGSNIFNVLGILGISAIIFPLTVKSNTTWIEIPLCLLSAVSVFVLSNDRLIDRTPVSYLSRIDGLILLLFFLIFVSYNIKLSRSGVITEEVEVKDYTIKMSLILLLSGFAFLIIGGNLIVTHASQFARKIGISERVIALTIVSIGTSLPELATSITAVRKRNVDLAIGNVVGSNLFNIFFILGLSSLMSPLSIPETTNIDTLFNIGISMLLFIFIFTGKGRKLDRWEGILFVLIYIVYLITLLI